MRKRLREGKVRWGQSGYSGYSMSNRAVKAYEDGEKPKSKWTKTAILDAIKNYVKYNEDILEYDSSIEKWTRDKLFNTFIEYKSWHHTGKYAQETDFYGLDKRYCDEFFLTQEGAIRKEQKKKEEEEQYRKQKEEKKRQQEERDQQLISILKTLKEFNSTYSNKILNIEDFKKLLSIDEQLVKCYTYDYATSSYRKSSLLTSTWNNNLDIYLIANEYAKETYLKTKHTVPFIQDKKLIGDEYGFGLGRTNALGTKLSNETINTLTDNNYAYIQLKSLTIGFLKVNLEVIKYILANIRKVFTYLATENYCLDMWNEHKGVSFKYYEDYEKELRENLNNIYLVKDETTMNKDIVRRKNLLKNYDLGKINIDDITTYYKRE